MTLESGHEAKQGHRKISGRAAAVPEPAPELSRAVAAETWSIFCRFALEWDCLEKYSNGDPQGLINTDADAPL